ncbi:hypothetical protein VTH06DRAFT_816 [Thermothelomyces fergusii]
MKLQCRLNIPAYIFPKQQSIRRCDSHLGVLYSNNNTNRHATADTQRNGKTHQRGANIKQRTEKAREIKGGILPWHPETDNGRRNRALPMGSLPQTNRLSHAKRTVRTQSLSSPMARP